MSYRKIDENIFYVGVIDWNRRLFDELIPLPEGTSYNSYIIKGSEKTALIDAADPAFEEEFFCTLRALGKEIGFSNKLDYIIANHGEQDHSGLIPKVLEYHPETKVVTNSKAKKVLADHLHIPDDRFIVIDDGGTLSLGDLTLEIIAAPWVHWPETQLVYLRERKMLFSCDMFGAHFATSNIFNTDDERFRIGAKRYFAEIMMPFRANILKHLEKLAKYDIACICPSHGPIHRDTSFIIDAYGRWSSDTVKNMVLLPYISMHGSTEKLVCRLTDALVAQNVDVVVRKLSVTDLGELAADLIDAATLVLGVSQVLGGAHPLAAHAAFVANALRPKTKFVSIVGSYGWGGKMVEQIIGTIPLIKAEIIEPVIVLGAPRDEDFAKIDALAATIAQKHAAICTR